MESVAPYAIRYESEDKQELTLKPKTEPKTFRQIDEAAQILRDGGLVALPSETVYGLGARADNEAAVARIFAVKNRPAINPLISHVENLQMAQDYVEFEPLALDLAQAFWPGALTLVLPKRTDVIAPNVSAGLDTLAIRAPAHPVFHAVIAALGVPIAAPSANTSGKLSPTTAEHVRADIGDKIDAILDGGPTEFGLESTVVLVENGEVTLLRHGAIPAPAIEAAIGKPVLELTKSDAPKSPGQLLRHYAPRTPIVLNARADDARSVDFWLGFGDQSEYDLSPTGDLREAAHNLFARLAKLDAIASNGAVIYIAPIPHHGIGVAINDRLERAAQSVERK